MKIDTLALPVSWESTSCFIQKSVTTAEQTSWARYLMIHPMCRKAPQLLDRCAWNAGGFLPSAIDSRPANQKQKYKISTTCMGLTARLPSE